MSFRCQLEDLSARVDALESALPICGPLGWVSVNADGSVASSCGDVSASRAAPGRYDLVPPAGASIVLLTVVEAENTRDSIEIHPTTPVGTRVHITEGDNGGSPNFFRDRAFTAVWF